MNSAREMSAGGVFLRGMAMGAADIVPGVSGGTVALITGIYDRLLVALSSVNAQTVGFLFTGQWRNLSLQIDARFLLLLLAGMATSVFLFANIIHLLMRSYPLPLWSLFFGLVLASIYVLGREERVISSGFGIWGFCLGAGVAIAIGLAPGAGFFSGGPGFFFAGLLAICAMILPGISGSFILLLLGMYAPVITAVTTLDMPLLGLFSLGCLLGLLLFSKALTWVLSSRRQATMAVLIGFLAGSLVTLWPWQRVISTVVDQDGHTRILQTQPITPVEFALSQGEHQLTACLIAGLVGAALVLIMHRHASVQTVGVQ